LTVRIGVFVCHCGSNIAAKVDVAEVAKAALNFPDVVFATHEVYTCSEPGQRGIQQAITEQDLDGVVVASCSPRMHENTFRKTVARAGLNPYMMEMANIREHVSWIGQDIEKNTRKAIDLVRIAAAKLVRDQPLLRKSFAVTRRVMVIGGGVAGIQAALDCADAGLEVILVERESTIGGVMAKLDKTFPTIDCSTCVLGPKMVEVAQHPQITLVPYAEVESVSGYVGNFKVEVKRKASYVDFSKCTGCGLCVEKCPSRKSPDKFNEQLGYARAINIPFPQAIPKVAVINRDTCIHFTKGKCGNCEKVCPAWAVDYAMVDRMETFEVGAVVAATGYSLFDITQYEEYGAGRYPDVITSLQYERMLNASGPTQGHVGRPSDGREPKTVVFVSCVGSRDVAKDRPYCSNFCCMYLAKQSILTKDHIPDSKSYVFYIDIRAPKKGYEEFVRRAQEEYGVSYIRGRVAKVYPKGDKLVVRAADTLMGTQVEVEADLVVLAAGVQAATGAPKLAEKLRISYDHYGFFMESHPKLRPIETNTAGVFLAGVCQGPKDIPESVAQGSAAAAKALVLLSKDKLETDPQVSWVNQKRCVGCMKCVQVCPFQAIQEVTLKNGEKKAEVIETVCQGCGICGVACPQSAIGLEHSKDEQILAEVEALCRSWTVASCE
jgi:heterodisulfide reductase subunit A